ncbi:imidazolonepropionase [Vibrio anguillarum]|uniref:imidazolonepropionase n=1 Tax=Vibrio anguillarum TaxID=55601 RepID=UPI00097E3E0A|nr:imidazolonepropionase [Vibrio anguillarum]AQM19382.1 imidazolonepropionase [Vibrio anguillarum]AUB87777.1 imidazolonepropionase [Vibrio anguillarum]AUB91219.1 imidazolonepropionase [Vibrio anguillarum]AUB94658.1 imidazolonepropionase [Vibrio anguillarum]AUB98076.1 imidazolonepropionase [Vibrio anguillarum]
MDLTLTNARIVSMEQGELGYQPSSPKTVVIKAGKIDAYFDSHIPIAAAPEHKVIDCQGKLITPGLIDCHTHLIYAGNRANEFEMRLQGVPYPAIAKQGGGILSTVHATRTASIDQLVELALPRLEGLLRSGVTSVEIKSGYGLTLHDEIKMLKAAKHLEDHRRIKVVTTLLAAHAIPPEYQHRSDDYVEHICQEIIPLVAEQKLASSVDVFCESIGFTLAQTEKVFQAAIAHGLQVKGHTEQLSNLGGSALTAHYQGLSADHIEYLDEQGVFALARSNTVATLLPGAFYFLRETQRPPIDLLRQHHIPMAIASDFNPGTSPFADLTLIMNMACTLFGLTPQEALRGVTQHAAQALGFTDSRGKIATGYDADLAIWNISHPADLSYQVGVPRLHARVVDGAFTYE